MAIIRITESMVIAVNVFSSMVYLNDGGDCWGDRQVAELIFI